MNWDIKHIFMTPPVTGVTINNVFLSPEFRVILYFFIAVILASGTLYFRAKKIPLSQSFQKAVIAAFFASGLLYAVYADMGWTKWLVADVKTYGGLSTKEKLIKMDDGLYEFSLQARNILDDDYQIFSSDNYMEIRLQYHLLPLHRREHAKYIIVIEDNEARFDESRGLLTRGKLLIQDVEPVFKFAQNAYILRRP